MYTGLISTSSNTTEDAESIQEDVPIRRDGCTTVHQVSHNRVRFLLVYINAISLAKNI